MSEEAKEELWGETWGITPSLRWNNGVLEQMWQSSRLGSPKWMPVPEKSDSE